MVYAHAHNNSDDLQMASSSGSSSFELLPLEGATSPVWEYFGFRAIDGQYIVKKKKDRKEVYCKLCKKVSFCYTRVYTSACLSVSFILTV